MIQIISFVLGLLVFISSMHAAQPIPLRAGPVTMVFDSDNAFLRYIRIGQSEILRGINAPIRDEHWSTVTPEVSNIQIRNRENNFDLTFDVICQDANIDFYWKGSISGNSQGEIEFIFEGVARSTFKRTRIGFCVLHSPSASGQPWLIETTDGKKTKGHFPELISPHQPAKNLRSVTHLVKPGVQARIDLEGEIFEMEDQRNWTDASFKTYCTPLNLPYPVVVPKGTKISQKIKVTLVENNSDPIPRASCNPLLTLTEQKIVLPRLGLQVSSEVQGLTKLQIQRLKKLNLDHLRIDLSLSEKSYLTNLRRAILQAQALKTSLHIGLNLGKSPDFAPLLTEVRKTQPPVSFWLVTGGDPADFSIARKQLKTVTEEAKIGVTRTTNFVDLNRNRPTDKAVEAVGFAINPQIHAFDNWSMVETLPIHADVVHTAQHFAGDRPLIIGPITLAPQFVNGEAPPGGPPSGPIPTCIDPRQVETFAAIWTLGSITYLAEAGAYSATYFETAGWKGIMDIDDVSNRPKAFSFTSWKSISYLWAPPRN